MADTVAAKPPTPVDNRALVFFVLYFAALLPGLAWGLWRLVTDNTLALPNVGVLANLPAGTVLADTAAFLRESAETRLVLDQGELILAVMLAGGIGSYIHGVNSFVTYVGNRSFLNSWMPWYFLRPFMGVGMAVIFYVVVRGGVLVMSGGESKVDPYAMMTVAALAGMFSKQASDKLAEVFDTLFRSRADAERRDKLEKPELKLGALAPAQVPAGSGDVVITATGSGFASDSVVKFDKGDRTATFKSATELTFALTAADVATAGEHTVAISSPAAGGGTSNQLKFTVTAVPPDGVGTTIQIPAVVRENAEGEVEVVSAGDEAGTAGAGATSEGDIGEATDENGASG